jgi:Fic family protein
VKWQPVQDLKPNDMEAANPELGPLHEVWLEQRERLADSGLLDTFIGRLVREWSIETGILERLYTIDRGVTQVLVEQGFDAALIPHGTTDRPAGEVIEILRDHQASAELVFDIVTEQRPLSVALIRELHALITRHQQFVDGQDQFGSPTQVLLLRGEFKKLPNSPTRPDGSVHEYCPPIHVDAEMDRLMEMYSDHLADGIPPDVAAAWLHHRFTQIHPFQDGNGRVARAITNIVFIRAGWFPLVIRSNSQRTTYIKALEAADAGDLAPLVALFGQIQKQAFVEALGLADTVRRGEVNLDQILDNIGDDLRATDQQRERAYSEVKPVADSLLDIAIEQVTLIRERLDVAFGDAPGRRAMVSHKRWTDEGHDWNRYTIIGAARTLSYYANVDSFSCWVRLRLITEAGHWEIVVGLHGLGSTWRGVVAGTILINRMIKDEDSPIRNVDIQPSVGEVFQLNYRDDPEQARRRFRSWLDAGLMTALQQWRASAAASS